jgi:F-type H+-transporting ATPase subunit delta
MAEKTTIARPYARAVFELARDKGKLTQWSEALAFAALVVRDPNMAALIASPRIAKDQAAGMLIDVVGERLDADMRNLVWVLAENRRLALLPEIAALYEQHRAEAEGTVEVHLTSATPVSEAQRARIADALKAKLRRAVNLQCDTDESLLGGAIIRAGDLVIDGSVRGKLSRLAAALGR